MIDVLMNAILHSRMLKHLEHSKIIDQDWLSIKLEM